MYYSLDPVGGRRIQNGKTIHGVQVDGSAQQYRILLDDGEIHIERVVWGNGEIDVRPVQGTAQGNQALEVHLNRSRFRMGVIIHTNGLYVVELSQARFRIKGGKEWANLKKADRGELNQGADNDVFKLLRELGTHNIQTREKILGERTTRKNYIVATFEDLDSFIPEHAFILTRILPMARYFGL